MKPSRLLPLLALASLTSVEALAAGYGRLEVKTMSRDASTGIGRPIGGAEVRVDGTPLARTSDSAGRALFDQVNEGPQRVVCSANGHTSRSFSVQIKANATAQVTCMLDAQVKAKASEAAPRKDVRFALRGPELEASISRPAVAPAPTGAGYSVGAKRTGMSPAPLESRRARLDESDNNREGYDASAEADFVAAHATPLSTFSIDVDTASYSNLRRILNAGSLPPASAVRIEEMLNAFRYDLPRPNASTPDAAPFAVHAEQSDAPWAPEHRLVRLSLQSAPLDVEALPPTNLVFLLDVSGSMNAPDKLPLLQQSLRLLVDQLRPQDTVALTVYAGAAGVVLPPTSGAQKARILTALDGLQAGGSTAGGQGIRLAYQVAREHFNAQGNNRVILATDGDFNVGTSSDGELVDLIERERASGVFLTVLGFGTGNYQDAKMQKLADAGNGVHAYIDSLTEARKVLVSELGATLLTVAKDVKLQVEFNPARVKGYRLIGYDNRRLADRDFDDDAKDAGELGAGHSVTALYEIVPATSDEAVPGVAPLKYQSQRRTSAADTDDLLTVKLRWKAPTGHTSRKTEVVVRDVPVSLPEASQDFRFAAAVAELGLVLSDSKHRGSASARNAAARAEAARGTDLDGRRAEFIALARRADALHVAQGRVSAIAR